MVSLSCIYICIVLPTEQLSICILLAYLNFSPCVEPNPMFDMTTYTVLENNRTIPLCIDIDVKLLTAVTYTIATLQKSPGEAEGKS